MIGKSRKEIPDMAGTIPGLRFWTPNIIGYKDDEPVYELAAPFTGAVWPKGETMVARCNRGIRHRMGPIMAKDLSDHEAPAKDCPCGLYAYKPGSPQASMQAGIIMHLGDLLFDGKEAKPRACMGVVKLWGKIEEHADGYRAQYAKTEALVLPERGELMMENPERLVQLLTAPAMILLAEGKIIRTVLALSWLINAVSYGLVWWGYDDFYTAEVCRQIKAVAKEYDLPLYNSRQLKKYLQNQQPAMGDAEDRD